MNFKSKLNRTAIALAVSVGLSTSAVAQVTTSGMTGQIVGPQGAPAEGTVITITHVPSGSKKTVQVNSAGTFSAKGLRIGGPYTIELDSRQFKDKIITDVYIDLGETLPVNVALEPDSGVEVISVTGSQIASLSFGKSSPAATFDLSDLQEVPAINRNINDVIRSDPRLFIDEGGNDGIQCAGKSPRFSSLTVDGVRQNDLFGLNSNGYPTERQPFPFDSIQGVAVEFAPFEVIYGGFTACNINAVTKSGTNEIHGSAFLDYTSDDFRGDSLEGEEVTLGNFQERRYGFEIGAPIIKDKLFIYAAYEKLEGANLFNRGPTDSDALVEVDVTQAELDEIVQIARDVYNYDPGQIPTSLDNEDEKIFVKLDWNINDQHRATLSYNYNDGNNFVQADGDGNEFEFQNHLYERGAELQSYIASFYSDWNDKFSTELRINYLEVDNRQNSLEGDGTVGGNDFGEFRVELPRRGDLDPVNVFLGSDDSRQANDLNYDQLSLIFRGFYHFDNGHDLTFGYERDDLDVFNLFIQHTEGEVRFAGIENFRNGFARQFEYNGVITGDANVQGELSDAAADWGFAINAAYIQDQFYLTDDLKITAGLRYEWYTSSDRPDENPQFTQSYGFSNATNLDGEGLLQPRLGLTYTLSDQTELRGGIGLFSGGNPNVWLSNNFSNTNTLQVGIRERNLDLFADDIEYLLVEDSAPVAGPGYGIPSDLVEAARLGDGRNFEINYLDPDFEIPSEWKFALGMTHVTESDYVFEADIIYSIFQNSAITLRGDLEESGQFTDEGYIIYDSPRLDSFVLTNADIDANALSISGTVTKKWDNGIQITTGYNYNDAEDINPMTSSVAFSNYNNRAFTNPNEQVASTSDFNIEHRFTFDFRFSHEFFAGLETTFSAFGLVQSGNPFSFVLDDRNEQGNDNQTFGFTPFLNNGNILPIGATRNDQESPWWSKVDIAVFQEVPAFNDEHSANVFLIIDNFTNLLNDEWGILEESPNRVFENSDSVFVNGDTSLWSLRLGLNYRF
jgi:outer membrane receptor for ferrienterochelin and colicin